jgi:hypothetical protein
LVQIYDGILTCFGRFRPITGARSGNSFERGKAMRLAQNTPIQGACADIMKFTMIKLTKAIKKDPNIEPDDIRLILTVHDELVAELKEDKLDYLVEFIIREMTLDLNYLQSQKDTKDWEVPILVDGDIGDSWGISLEWEKYKETYAELNELDRLLREEDNGQVTVPLEDSGETVVGEGVPSGDTPFFATEAEAEAYHAAQKEPDVLSLMDDDEEEEDAPEVVFEAHDDDLIKYTKLDFGKITEDSDIIKLDRTVKNESTVITSVQQAKFSLGG